MPFQTVVFRTTPFISDMLGWDEDGHCWKMVLRPDHADPYPSGEGWERAPEFDAPQIVRGGEDAED